MLSRIHRSRARLARLAGLIALSAACTGEGDGLDDPSLIHTVGRGDLSITVRERAEVRAAHDTRISSELEGRATLIYLIAEGTVVGGGEKVAELDVSAIAEKRAQQAISVAKTEAALEQARKTVEIVEKELKAAGRTAETRVEIAKLRLEKFVGQRRGAYGETHGTNGAGTAGTAAPAAVQAGTNAEMLARLRGLSDASLAVSADRMAERVIEVLGSKENLQLEMGELATQILRQIDVISLARAELQLAEETLFFSRKLSEKGFITGNELKRDEINHDRQLSTQAVAWNDLLLLINYTLPETLLTLELEVENAGLNLESVRAQNDARRVREDAELKSIEAEFELAMGQLRAWDDQIAKGVLRAPGPGLVVYGRYDWDEPVYEGMEVRERQEVILLPDITSMVADIRVPESQIGKLAVGQRTTLQVDAFPGRVFTGRVTTVASLPEPSPRSQVQKNYITTVPIDGKNDGGAVRPGMNATVTIEVGTIAGVLNVPLPALERRGDAHFVWKATPQGPTPVAVGLGANNLTHVEIVAGLAEGDRIYLVRPAGMQLPRDESETSEMPEPDEPPSAEAPPASSGGAAPDGAPAPGAPEQGGGGSE